MTGLNSAQNGVKRRFTKNFHSKHQKKALFSLIITKKFIPLHRFRKTKRNMVAVVQLVRASDCGSECRRFESDQPPFG